MADAMDSKSISREGVGVQVPASAPVAHEDELARALLGALLHRLNNVTQVISSVNALVRLGGESAAIARHAEDLRQSAEGLERLGWLLALLSRQRGSDLLLARREARGQAWLLELLREAVRRERRELGEPRPGSLEPDPAREEALELGWACAGWLFAAARELPERGTLAWGIEARGERVRLCTSCTPREAHELALAIARRVPGAGLEREPDGRLTLELPAQGWRPPALS